MAWNAHAHGSPLHFVTRVTSFRQAVGAADLSLVEKVFGYPVALIEESPEAFVLGLVGLSGFLLPGAPLKTSDMRCPAIYADNDRAVRGEIDMVLYGRIDYRDIFRANRSTTFCYFLNAGGAAFCGCHNEIDPGEKH